MYRLTIAILLVSGILIFACGDSKKATVKVDPADYLIQKFDQNGIERVSEVRRFIGETLYEYINGGAEIYHLYDFIEVVTADYKVGETEIVADIYSFENPDLAYGMFSTLRPLTPAPIGLGVEGFSFGSSLDFVKGNYIIRIIGYDETSETASAIEKLSNQLNSLVPGRTSKPERFAVFPQKDRIDFTEKIHAQSFLGQKALTDIYSMNFQIESDTITLFLSDDKGGGKFKQWFEAIEYDEASMKAAKSLPFDQPKALMIEDSYYGTIVAGLKNDNLIGIIGYKDQHKDFLLEWVNSLK
ncbi:MAG: hypothetical protein GY839_15660 [candidate division Zixibacteria bacterium]|nr:hypothetical protein [candidate division Zixibacteria bacterium]